MKIDQIALIIEDSDTLDVRPCRYGQGVLVSVSHGRVVLDIDVRTAGLLHAAIDKALADADQARAAERAARVSA